jgi:hypothetical protein
MTRSTASGTSLGTAGVPVPAAPQRSPFSSSSRSRGRGVGVGGKPRQQSCVLPVGHRDDLEDRRTVCCAARDNRSSNGAREVCTVIRPRRHHCSFLMLPPLLVLRRPFFLRVCGRRRCFGFCHDDANARKLSLLTVERNRFLLAFEAPMRVFVASSERNIRYRSHRPCRSIVSTTTPTFWQPSLGFSSLPSSSSPHIDQRAMGRCCGLTARYVARRRRVESSDF